MLSKLALRNAKRSLRDYVIYLITVVLAFSLMFSFNLVVFSKDIMELSSAMENFRVTVIMVSVLVIIVVGWLIYYTMKFMFAKRSKEFGTYMILGIEKKKITRMFLLENIILGAGALVVSFFLGFFFSQFMTLIIMNIFALPYRLNFSFGIEPVLLTISYFVLIYFFVLLLIRRRIRKMKLYNLLYFDQQNEKKIYKTKKSRVFVFVFSILLGVGACLMFHHAFQLMINNESGNTMALFFGSLLSLTVSIYGISLTFADFFTSFVLRQKKFKYTKDHLFITRQFSSKVKTMGITVGTLSLLITLTFLSLNVSNAFSGMFRTQTESSAPYDVMLYNLYSETEDEIGTNPPHRLEEYLTFVEEHYQIEEQLTYFVYTDRNTQIRAYISDGVTGYQPFDCYIRLSDYNRLVEMRGLPTVQLKENEFYIHSFRDVSKELQAYLKGNPRIRVGDHTLVNKGMTDYKYTTSWSRGSSYIVIVPDQVIDSQFEIVNQITMINTKEETTEAFANEMTARFAPKVYIEDSGQYETLISIQQVTVKARIVGENRSMITILSFSLMYLAFVFVAVVGTILSIQSLSDSTKYRYRYVTLSKLGVEEKQIYRTLKKQLLIFFLFPVLYPIIISCGSSVSIGLLFNPFLESDFSLILYVLVNIVLFLFIYILYYVATYFGFKKNIREQL